MVYNIYIAKNVKPGTLSGMTPVSTSNEKLKTLTYAFDANSKYWIGVSALDGEESDAGWFSIETDASGNVTGTRPNPPVELSTKPVQSNLLISWKYQPGPIGLFPESFKIYELATLEAAPILKETVTAGNQIGYTTIITPSNQHGYIKIDTIGKSGLINIPQAIVPFNVIPASITGSTWSQIA